MYYYRNPHQVYDNRFGGIGWPLVGGFLGGLLGSTLIARRFYGYPGVGYPGIGYPGVGFPGLGYQGPGPGYPGFGAPIY
jgi:hypothetical protein